MRVINTNSNLKSVQTLKYYSNTKHEVTPTNNHYQLWKARRLVFQKHYSIYNVLGPIPCPLSTVTFFISSYFIPLVVFPCFNFQVDFFSFSFSFLNSLLQQREERFDKSLFFLPLSYSALSLLKTHWTYNYINKQK